MESHPVPQNVTAFEFHLIGDMTIKQFGYLAVGLAIAYFTYLGLFQSAAWIAIPIIIVSAGMGIALAFLPIQDQPLDHWLGAFFRAVYSPTQMEWHLPSMKEEMEQPYIQDRLNKYLRGAVSQVVATSPDAQTAVALASAPALAVAPVPQVAPVAQTAAAPTSQPAQPAKKAVFNENLLAKLSGGPQVPDLPSDSALQKTVALAKEAQVVQQEIVQTEKKMDQLKQAAAQPGVQPGTYANQIQTVVGDLQGLVHKAQELSTEMAGVAPHPIVPQPTTSKPAPTIRPIRRTVPKLTSTPNVINGIVTDVEGNYLENVVVVIHNQDGLPVRALKTNKLGQFTGSTPLPDGPYNLTLEKETLSFDPIKVTLNNQVMAPLEVQAKKGATITA